MVSYFVNDILNNILKDNVSLINNKYLIFNVLNSENELCRTCFGTIDSCIPADTDSKETMSTTSPTDELYSFTNERSE
ncbi:lef-10 [Cryptophlebia leucotreta granulovirus]|uniref:Late expression factor-10 n=1 Tax=Cryptophlebia leucotreta granulosis virus TaxID=35254 RepID=Q7T5G9_GVCL|nr:lef-10 [Cryptophlebia leucotreta granulovirus]AAQ21719.1 lef-10 [Cryptophlebia leucotreta granulovirus]AUF82078.1 late expression factor-10 [Cryptophlebia leucotreta granulovirus]